MCVFLGFGGSKKGMIFWEGRFLEAFVEGGLSFKGLAKGFEA